MLFQQKYRSSEQPNLTNNLRKKQTLKIFRRICAAHRK